MVDDLLASQLRAYGDALEAVHGAGAVGPAVDPLGPQRDLRGVAAVAAVLLLVVSGSVAWLLRDFGAAVVETEATDDSVTSWTPLRTAPQDVRVLPDSKEWVMVEAGSFDGAESKVAGVWVWRVDGSIVTLVSPFGGEVASSLASARPVAEHNRVTVGWQTTSSETVGLQAIGLDPDRLMELAAELEQSAEGEWRLVGHDPIATRAPGPGPSRVRRYAVFSTESNKDDTGLRGEIGLAYFAGAEAELYGELFDASSFGDVESIEMLGRNGYVVRGEEVQTYALVYVDGVIVRASNVEVGVKADVDGFIASLRFTDPETWNAAVDRLD